LIPHPTPIQRNDRPVFLEDGDVSHRRVKRKLRHGQRFQIALSGCETGATAAVKGGWSEAIGARDPKHIGSGIFVEHTRKNE
jgi:hypothetical protein